MSASYIKDVKVYSAEYLPWKNHPECVKTLYAVVDYATDSNCYNTDGTLAYHNSLLTVGDHWDVMHKVCRIAGYFEDGQCQWKPRQKTPEAYIKYCRNAINNATPGKLPKYFAIAESSEIEYIEFYKILATLPEVITERWGETYCLETNDIVRYYELKCFCKEVVDEYRSGMGTLQAVVQKYAADHSRSYADDLIALFV
jgi:hypothetical protein